MVMYEGKRKRADVLSEIGNCNDLADSVEKRSPEMRTSGDYTMERKQWLRDDPEKYLAAVLAHGKKKTRK